MSRQAKIIIFSLILIFSYFTKSNNEKPKITKTENISTETSFNNSNNADEDLIINDYDKWTKPLDNSESVNNKPAIEYFPTPKNGFSPYDNYVGRGIYDNNAGNEFEIKNSNSTHAIVLLVNAYSGKKIRNEFISKGSDFLMTGVPNGTYYLQWFSGDDWSPELRIGGFKGGFQTNQSFTKTRDMSDWMKVSGFQKWTVTLYSVQGGDVESETINPSEFLK